MALRKGRIQKERETEQNKTNQTDGQVNFTEPLSAEPQFFAEGNPNGTFQFDPSAKQHWTSQRRPFPEQKTTINFDSLMPQDIEPPLIARGEHNFKIVDVQIKEGLGYNHGITFVRIKLANKEHTVVLRFNLRKKGVYFAKWVNDVLGKVPEGEFDPKVLQGWCIKGFVSHFYTNNGQVYTNVEVLKSVAPTQPTNDDNDTQKERE